MRVQPICGQNEIFILRQQPKNVFPSFSSWVVVKYSAFTSRTDKTYLEFTYKFRKVRETLRAPFAPKDPNNGLGP
jgi:hypothetical protein